MSNFLSASQLEFRAHLDTFFKETCGSEFARAIMTGKKPRSLIWEKVKEIGLFEYVQSGEGGFQIIGDVAFYAARYLAPIPLAECLFVGPYVFANSQVKVDFSAEIPSGSKLVAEIESGQLRLPIAVSERLLDLENGAKLEFKFVSGALAESLICVLSADGISFLKLNQGGVSSSSGTFDCINEYFDVQGDLSSSCNCKLPEAQALFRLIKSFQLAGIAEAALALTLEYLKTRRQFDREIGSFQALQHKASEMYLAVEGMKALSNFAAWAVDNSKEQLQLAATSAFVFACENSAKVVEQAIQLHGGIGFTYEYDLHLLLRQAKLIEILHSLKEEDRARFMEVASSS